eukprot:GHRR01033694.1.p1 GENE.GHRR01033694.1~~GHRR01033694.1.p1  ORF type:complete len:233 (+),score=40.02 GHRR01033694.1:1498-2196(+)
MHSLAHSICRHHLVHRALLPSRPTSLRATRQPSPQQSVMSSTDDLTQANDGKLKLICLHGFMQNSDVFRMRTGSLRKSLKSRVHFIFQDAPFHAASTLTEEQVKELGGSSQGLTWFQWTDLRPDKRPSLAVKYSNWDQTYSTLCEAMKQHQPEGLLGFSQGATAAALFAASLQLAQRQGRDLDVPVPKFCIVVSSASSVLEAGFSTVKYAACCCCTYTSRLCTWQCTCVGVL